MINRQLGEGEIGYLFVEVEGKLQFYSWCVGRERLDVLYAEVHHHFGDDVKTDLIVDAKLALDRGVRIPGITVDDQDFA